MQSGADTTEIYLAEIVTSCRLGDYGDASSLINRCIPSFEALQKDPAIASARKPLLDKINFSLETVVLMLGRKDWVAVADIIEFELLPMWTDIQKTSTGPTTVP
jgi:hypothetical protein